LSNFPPTLSSPVSLNPAESEFSLSLFPVSLVTPPFSDSSSPGYVPQQPLSLKRKFSGKAPDSLPMTIVPLKTYPGSGALFVWRLTWFRSTFAASPPKALLMPELFSSFCSSPLTLHGYLSLNTSKEALSRAAFLLFFWIPDTMECQRAPPFSSDF